MPYELKTWQMSHSRSSNGGGEDGDSGSCMLCDGCTYVR